MLNVTPIPLNRLVPARANVRRTGRDSRIDELAASIAAHGLLQNLTVRAVPPKPKKAATYEVIAGGRRLAALKRLVKDKALAADAPIPCHVLAEVNVTEISLAENVLVCPMHPADQFEAFFKLHSEDGMSAEDIAARFGVTAAVVRQRLKLAAVSPVLMQAYRDEEINLDQLTGFAITDDHGKQERVFEELGYRDSRQAIVEALTEEHVAADDRRAVFVGLDAYQAAGGAILRDLFDEEGDGFLIDTDLVHRLAAEKLEALAASVRTEGWKWVMAMTRYDHAAVADLRRVYPEAAPLSEADQAKLDALEAELEAMTEDDGTTATQAEIADIEHSIAVLRGEDAYDPAVIAIAGAIVSIDYDGEVCIERGFIRREDDSRPSSRKAAAPKDGPAPLSASLVAELTATRTLALRNRLSQQPGIALTAVTHALAAPVFFPFAGQVSCLEIKGRWLALGAHAPDIEQSEAARGIAERHAAWAKRMPDEAEGLWPFVVGLSESEQLALLAHCAALTLNAVQTPHGSNAAGLAHADQVVEAVQLDMRAYWRPTAKGYFGRISKERILDAVREGVSAAAADNLATLKKGALAEAAEQRLQGRDWLPTILRGPDAASASPELAEAA